jgi:hypothetical protein
MQGGAIEMASTLGGDDPSHDLTPEQKDREERKLREEARHLLGGKDKKERNKKLNRANEISRAKAKRAHQGTD